MKDAAFIIVDESLQVEAYHPNIFNLFSIPESDHPMQDLQRLLENHPDWWGKIERLISTRNGKTSDTFTLDSHSSTNYPIEITIFKSFSGIKNHKIVIYFSKNYHPLKYQIPLWRSLKYNALSKLAPSIAHEIRNPLSSLAIHTEILDNTLPLLTLPGEQYQRIKKSIMVLHSELERVMKILDRFFRLARSGVKESSYEDLNSILLEAFELVKPQCYEQGIKIDLHLEKNIPFVYLNRDELLHVLLNILINAMESLSEGGAITMRSKKSDKSSYIFIQDNGHGISSDDLKKIFSENLSHKNSGSGMSLISAKQLIENLGGKIAVESDQQLGTIFSIELPHMSQF